MEGLNDKRIEEALRIFVAPMTCQGHPMLEMIEYMARVKKVYAMGVEDGLRQHEADNIIKSANGGD